MSDPNEPEEPPVSFLFRNAVNNMARFVEQLEDGDFDFTDANSRQMFRDVVHRVELLTCAGDRMFRRGMSAYRLGELRRTTLKAHADMLEDATP